MPVVSVCVCICLCLSYLYVSVFLSVYVCRLSMCLCLSLCLCMYVFSVCVCVYLCLTVPAVSLCCCQAAALGVQVRSAPHHAGPPPAGQYPAAAEDASCSADSSSDSQDPFKDAASECLQWTVEPRWGPAGETGQPLCLTAAGAAAVTLDKTRPWPPDCRQGGRRGRLTRALLGGAFEHPPPPQVFQG